MPCDFVWDLAYGYGPEAIPPTLFTIALEWRGLRNGLSTVTEVERREYSSAASVNMLGITFVTVGLSFFPGER